MQCWTYQSRFGAFDIVPLGELYHIMHDGEAIAAYQTPEEAAKALAAGDTGWPPFCDPRDLDVPADLAKWHSRPLV